MAAIPTRLMGPLCLVAVLAAAAQGQMQFFASVGSNPSGDLAFQAAAGQSFFECDFEAYPVSGTIVTEVPAGNVTASVVLRDVQGAATDVPTESFTSTIGVFNQPGAVHGAALLNGDSGQSTPLHPIMEFRFDRPVRGFGTWIFDDDMATNSRFVMVARDEFGLLGSSPVIDAAQGGHEIEGFLGVVGASRIVSVQVILQDAVTGKMVSNRSFEVDHVQIVPALDVWITQQGGPGTAVTLQNAGLAPGMEYFNLVSLDACGIPGAGPYAGIRITSPPNQAFLASQLMLPVGTPPFHFSASTPFASWGPYALPAGTVDLLCIEVNAGVLVQLSAVTRATIL